MTLLTIAIILTLAYNLAAAVKNKGILPSLSDSFYVFGGKPKGYVFYGYCAAMFFLLVIPMIGNTSENWEWSVFLCLFGLCLVGAAADFWCEFDKTPHFIGAIGCAVCALIWCSAVGHWDTALWSMGIAVVAAFINPKSKVYWLEMGCFASVFITLLCY